MEVPDIVRHYDEERVLKHIDAAFKERNKLHFPKAADHLIEAAPGSPGLAASVLLASVDAKAIRHRLKKFSGATKGCLDLFLQSGFGGPRRVRLESDIVDIVVSAPRILGEAAQLLQVTVSTCGDKDKPKWKHRLSLFLQSANQLVRGLSTAAPDLILLSVESATENAEGIVKTYTHVAEHEELRFLLRDAAKTYSEYLADKGKLGEALQVRESAQRSGERDNVYFGIVWEMRSLGLAKELDQKNTALNHIKRIKKIVETRISKLCESLKTGFIQNLDDLSPILGLADSLELLRNSGEASFVKTSIRRILELCLLLGEGGSCSGLERIRSILTESNSRVAWGNNELVLTELIQLLEIYRLLNPAQDRIWFEKQCQVAELCFDRRHFHIVSARQELHGMKDKGRAERLEHLKSALDHFAKAYRWWRTREAYGCYGVWGALLYCEKAREEFDRNAAKQCLRSLDQAKRHVSAAREVYGDSGVVTVLDNAVSALETTIQYSKDAGMLMISGDDMRRIEQSIERACEVALWKQIAMKHPIAYEVLKPSMESIKQDIPPLLEATRQALIKEKARPRSTRLRENIDKLLGVIGIVATLLGMVFGPFGLNQQIVGAVIIILIILALWIRSRQ